MIQHIAISINQIKEADSFIAKIKEIIEKCIDKQVPVLTFNFPETDFDILEKVMEQISAWEKINPEKIKLNVFGKWYDFPSRIVEKIKKLINETKHYDTIFLNICIKYDGQEEITDTCKV